MTDSETDQSPAEQVQAARKAFEQEFERFARFIDDSSSLAGLDLDQALAEQRALADLRTRHLGKKSALAATKKLIGRVAAADRAAFGQVVQATEAALVKSFFEYAISPEGQELAAEAAGSAPLSSALTEKVEAAVGAIE